MPPVGYKAVTRIGTVTMADDGAADLDGWEFGGEPFSGRIADPANTVICGHSVWYLVNLTKIESQWTAPPRDDLYPPGHPHHKEPSP